MSDWGAAGRGALGMGATGAGIGTMFAPGVGTAIGGGIGALAGGLMGLFGSGPDEEEIYNKLLQQYLQSPERAREQAALDDLQKQTVDGPTAQEHTALNQALKVANDQFGSSYGSILGNLRARSAAGGGGAAEAALAASEGAGRSNKMFDMAEGAAAQESARQMQAREAYARLAAQVQQIGDQYRQWASGRAHGDRMINEAAGMGTLNQAAGAIAAGVAAYKNGKKPGDPSDANLDGSIPEGSAKPERAPDVPLWGSMAPKPEAFPDLGFNSWLSPSGQAAPSPQGQAPFAMEGDPNAAAPTAAEWAQQYNRRVNLPNRNGMRVPLWNDGGR